MKEAYQLSLEKALEEEKKGNPTIAYDLYKNALDISGSNSGPVLFEFGRFLFLQGLYSQALEILIQCYKTDYRADEVLGIIMEAYYEPNIEEFKIRYERNVKSLSLYEHIYHRDFPDFSSLRYCFLPIEEDRYMIYDKENGIFLKPFDLNEGQHKYNQYKIDQVIIIKNELSSANISLCLEKTNNPGPYLWMKTPEYLFYDDANLFTEFLQVNDFTALLETKRVVFLFGEEELEEWFSDPQTVYPTHALDLGNNSKDFYNSMYSKYQQRLKDTDLLQEQVNYYYENLPNGALIDQIKGEQPRILFVTCRFTTALQYYTRDCLLACDKLGIPNRLIIEKSDIHRVLQYDWLMTLNEFKPNIIFMIDHFRWEYSWIPENIVFISWIQDPLPTIMCQSSAGKIQKLDFILNLFFSSKEFFQLGYPANQLIDAPIPANHYLYNKYKLTEEEKKEFTTDICLFSNAGDPKKGLEEFIKLFGDASDLNTIRKVFELVYEETYKLIYNEQPLYSIESYAKIIEKWSKKFGLEIDQENLQKISETFRLLVGFRIFRSVPLEWLHEKGYKMKLWGREWVEHPLLKGYALGVAPNGETLSKIINASKIVLGTNPGLTTHPRVFEAILSNSFYLGVNIPEEYDWANVRRFMEEDKEITFFYSKEDLYKKVDYYLAEEEERKQIIDRGKKKILQSLTFEALMKRVINEIASKLDK